MSNARKADFVKGEGGGNSAEKVARITPRRGDFKGASWECFNVSATSKESRAAKVCFDVGDTCKEGRDAKDFKSERARVKIGGWS